MRRFLTVVLPILLPFLLYGLYLLLARRRARRDGTSEPPAWREGPWHWVLVAGVLLLGASLLVSRQFSGVEPGVPIEPSRIAPDQRNDTTPAESSTER